MRISEIIINALPNTVYGAVIGFTTGIIITAALERISRPSPGIGRGAIPYAISKAVAPLLIVSGGIVCGSIGGIAGGAHSVAQQIFFKDSTMI